MTAAERALFVEHMREAEAEHAAYADEGGTPPYKHARDVALACRLAAMVAEPDAVIVALAQAMISAYEVLGASYADGAHAVLTTLLALIGAAEEAQT